MKHLVKMSALAFLLTMFTVPAQASDAVGKLGFGLNGGLGIPVSGDITADSSFGDFFDVGPAFGLHVRYGVVKELTLETGFRYAYHKMKDEANESLPAEPYVVLPEIYLDGILNFGAFMGNPDNIFNPFVKAGVAMVPWKATDDGAGGDAVVLDNGEEFKKTSLGLNFGAGLEVFATPDMALFAEGRYLMVFSEDEDKFGEDFGNMGDININVGLTYYIPLSSR